MASVQEIEAELQRRERTAEIEAELRRRGALEPTEPSFIDRAMTATGDAAKATWGAIKGDPGEKIPSIYSGSFTAQNERAGKTAFAPAMAAVFGGDDDIVKAIQSQYPDATVSDDGKGNPVIQMADGQRYYVNAPGLDSTDVGRFAGKVMQYVPAGKAAGLGGGLLSRMLIGGAASGLTDMATQKLAGRDEIDKAQVALTTGTGAAAELIAPAFGAAYRGVKSWVTPISKQVEQGKTLAASLGVGNVSDDAAVALFQNQDQIAAGADPRAIIAQQEFGYKLTRGQLTGKESTLRREELLRSANPDGPIGQLDRFNIQQTEKNVDRLRAMAARGGVPETYEQDAAQRVREGLERARGAAQQQVRGAYGEVPSKSAFASPDDVAALGSRLDEAFIGKDIIVNESLTPTTLAARQLVEQAAKASGGAPMRMDRLIDLRKALGRMRGSAVKEDARAYSQMMDEFDGWFDQALTRNLMEGDPGAVAPFREANKIASRFFSLFEDRKSEPGKAVMRMLTEDATPEQVANVILNANGINKPGAAAIAKRYIEAVGRDTDGVTAMREIVARRLLEKAGDPKGHQALVSSLKDALSGRGRSLMRELFTTTELATLQRFSKTLDDFLVPKGMLGRSSGTAERLAAFMAQFRNVPIFSAISTVNKAVQERSATLPLLANRSAAVPAAIVAGTYDQRERERD